MEEVQPQAGLMLAFMATYVGIIVFFIICMWRIYTKAGKPGWASIIPMYSNLVFLEIIGKPWWWLLMLFIPIVNIVFIVWGANLLSKSFGKTEGFTAGLIILSFIFMPILAFGSAKYIGPGGRPIVQPDLM
nr:hypothetical protein [Bacteroidota bacterium]